MSPDDVIKEILAKYGYEQQTDPESAEPARPADTDDPDEAIRRILANYQKPGDEWVAYALDNLTPAFIAAYHPRAQDPRRAEAKRLKRIVQAKLRRYPDSSYWSQALAQIQREESAP